jgi:hypothetical protein
VCMFVFQGNEADHGDEDKHGLMYIHTYVRFMYGYLCACLYSRLSDLTTEHALVCMHVCVYVVFQTNVL